MQNKNNISLAPIVLFVYNRPDHTLQTLQALTKNILADESTLIIYADGPKTDSPYVDYEKIKATREVIRQQRWCKKVVIHESEVNMGLADAIVQGVTDTVNQYGKVIVLEDDIVISPGFLQYMNDALNLYEHNEQVMHVSGYIFPVNAQLPDTFFYNTGSCWGWGTWKRAWQHFQSDAAHLAKEIKKQNRIHQFNVEDSYPFYRQLEKNAEGEIKTWAVKWYASFFLQNGYALHPYPSLVNNIGTDGSGENHKSKTEYYQWSKLARSISVEPISVIESALVRKAMVKYYNLKHVPRNPSMKMSLKRKMGTFLPKSFKHLLKQVYNSRYKNHVQELKRLSQLPRYTESTTNILEKPVKLTDAASFLFIYKEIFESEIYDFKSARKAPYILDCGANIGMGILYFKKKYPAAQIIAFEPDEKAFRVLQENMKTFGYQDVKLIQKGLWHKETTLQFFSEGADGGRVADNEDQNIVEIKTTRLRNYLEQEVDFLKIDIEGAETEVLLDCQDLLSNVRRIFIEYHSFRNKTQTLSEILNILREAGFRYYFTTPGLISKNPFLKVREYMNMDMQLNIYGIRK